MAQTTIKTRLCPHCANSIALDALICPYCKADLILSVTPEWPQRSGDTENPSSAPGTDKLPVRSKVILGLGLLVFALGIYLVGGSRERSDLSPVMEEQEKALRAKDQKIQDLETQLAQLRQEQQGITSQIDELKAKLEESQKDSASTRRKLTEANREVDRRAASRSTAGSRPAARTADPIPPPSNASSRRQAETGVYETVRSTAVYEEPSGSARVVAQIGKGTEVTVTRSVDDWLEVKSKHGKPPGFIRADDARVLGRAN